MPKTSVTHVPKDGMELMLGNEAIARGALEAGVNFAAGYPGTPSSEIIQTLSQWVQSERLYVEWSTNEKVATEAAAAAAFAGLRSLAAMKNAGLSVALDFLTHLSLTGLGKQGGAMVAVVCDDPDAHSSGDETDSRWIARFCYTPLLEPSSVSEAKEITRWAFELSQRFACFVLVRSYTRLSHASSPVSLGDVHEQRPAPRLDPSVTITPYLAKPKHAQVIQRLREVERVFEESPFNLYEGPASPQLLIICSGNGYHCAREAVDFLGLEGRVGVLKLVTLWPLPKSLIQGHLRKAQKVLIVEEVDPYLETQVKAIAGEEPASRPPVLGKESGHIPAFGEITPEAALEALGDLFHVSFRPRPKEYEDRISAIADPLIISRGLTWCAGCPHRASFWALERAVKAQGGRVYVTGDIGCYTLDVFPEGKGQMNLLHAMGSGTGLANGIGHLGKFGHPYPVIAICGDSTFFHASIAALINAVHNESRMIQVILDNEATAMTGFQPHPGTPLNAMGGEAVPIMPEDLCRAMGCTVEVCDPFDIKGTTKTIRRMIQDVDKGPVQVLVLRRSCELLRMRKQRTRPYYVCVDPDACRGEKCGVCTSQFRCPAIMLDPSTQKALIRQEQCPGCGVCADICPFKAIERQEQAT